MSKLKRLRTLSLRFSNVSDYILIRLFSTMKGMSKLNIRRIELMQEFRGANSSRMSVTSPGVGSCISLDGI